MFNHLKLFLQKQSPRREASVSPFQNIWSDIEECETDKDQDSGTLL